MAILQEFARHSSHKAEDDFPHSGEVLELGYDPFIYIRDGIELGGGALVEEALLRYKRRLFANQA